MDPEEVWGLNWSFFFLVHSALRSLYTVSKNYEIRELILRFSVYFSFVVGTDSLLELTL